MEKLFCSFCRKSQDEVATLMAGPDISICSECIECMIGILAENVEWRDRQIESLTALRDRAKT